jgi:hypothetical protein
MISSSTGDALTGSQKYSRATAMKFVLFLLSLTSINATYTTVAVTGDAVTGYYKYSGAAAIGTKVYFAPCTQNNVGIYDAATSAFSTAATPGLTGSYKYSARTSDTREGSKLHCRL